MKPNLIRLSLPILLLSLTVSVAAQTAPRDPAVDAELAELRQKLVQLQAENAELRQQVDRMQKQNDQMRSLLREQGGTVKFPSADDPAAPPSTVDVLQLVTSVAESVPETASPEVYEKTMEEAMVEQVVHGRGTIRFTGRLDDKGIISVKTTAEREGHTYELSLRVLVDRNAIRRHKMGQSLAVSGRISKVAAVRTKKDEKFQHTVTLVIKEPEVTAQPEPEPEPDEPNAADDPSPPRPRSGM